MQCTFIIQAVRAYFCGKATPEIESIKLTLEEDQVTLDIPLEGIDIPEGWKVTPCYCPTVSCYTPLFFTDYGMYMHMLCYLFLLVVLVL